MKNRIIMLERDSIEFVDALSCQSLPLHSHECFCFGVVKDGSVRFRIGNQEKLLTKNMAYIIPSNVGVTIQADTWYAYTTICLKNEIREYLSPYDYSECFVEIDSLEEFEVACETYIHGGAKSQFLKSIYPYIQQCQSTSKFNKNQDMNENAVEEAKNYIKSHIYEEFDLELLCKLVHMSKYHFIRVFKQKTGVPPKQYYLQAKLYVVKQMLKNNEKGTDVAAELNFADQSYLCNVFKKRMGISMRDFQKSYHAL